jgi:hypothetical protein
LGETPADRRDIDDGSGLAASHTWEHGLNQIDRPKEVGLKSLFYLIILPIFYGRAVGIAGVVNEYVDFAEASFSVFYSCCYLQLISDIQCQAQTGIGICIDEGLYIRCFYCRPDGAVSPAAVAQEAACRL